MIDFKKILMLMLLMFGMISLVSADLTTNNQAYWTYDNVLTDATGNGNTLTNNGATYTASGKINGGFDFDGTNDYMRDSTSPISSASAFTISVWVNPCLLYTSDAATTPYV